MIGTARGGVAQGDQAGESVRSRHPQVEEDDVEVEFGIACNHRACFLEGACLENLVLGER
ncbi:MAG: hypothetical protein U1E35_04970 [Rhodospirillales bacterium]